MDMNKLDELGNQADATSTDVNGNKKDDFDYEAAYKASQEEIKNMNDEKSGFGRKFKAYQEEENDKYKTLLTRMEMMENSKFSGKGADNDDDLFNDLDDENDKNDATSMKRIADKAASDAIAGVNKQRQDYIESYDRALLSLGADLDDSTYSEILELVGTMDGQTTNGGADAQTNFNRAHIQVLNARVSNKQAGNSSFREDNPAGTNMGGSGSNNQRDPYAAELEAANNDPHTQSFLQYRASKGKTNNDEFMKTALGLNVGRV